MSFILPAAGSGSRMGSNIPKPFLPFGPAQEPVVFTTLRALAGYASTGEIVLVLPPDQREALLADHEPDFKRLGVTATVPGGASRQESVSRGLAAIEQPCDLIAVHDAVRPFPSPELLIALANAAATTGGALPVLPVTDTIKRVGDTEVEGNRIEGEVHETVPRQGLYAVQTPQVFDATLLRSAYEKAQSLGEEITDDASLVEAAGGTVTGVLGDRFNLKLTTREDLDLAAALMSAGLVL
jgi:2-C-methyl-D-erythritol 4-phosphate cytidylyltransferase